MELFEQYKSAARAWVFLSVITLISACGGGSGGVDSQSGVMADPTVQAIANVPEADPGTAEFVPNLGTGLDISFDDPNGGNVEYIEAQWIHMQTCLQVSAQEPTVVVVEGAITPVDSNDDVVRHIDGQIQASSHVTETSAAIQIRSEDFDGSLGKPGTYLRSIMGRYLWLANNLPEREYNYECGLGE